MKKTLKIKKEVESEVELPIYVYEEYSDEEMEILTETYSKIDSDDNNFYQTSIHLENDKLVEFNFQVLEDSNQVMYFEDELKITKEEFYKQLDKLNELVKNLNKDNNE